MFQVLQRFLFFLNLFRFCRAGLRDKHPDCNERGDGHGEHEADRAYHRADDFCCEDFAIYREEYWCRRGVEKKQQGERRSDIRDSERVNECSDMLAPDTKRPCVDESAWQVLADAV